MTDAHGPDFAETRGDSTGSTVAVHRQIRRHPCGCFATTGAHGPVSAETRGDSTGLQLQFIDKFVSIPVVSKRLILIVRLSTRRHRRKLWRVFEIGELLPGHPFSSRHPSWRFLQLLLNTGNPLRVVKCVEPAPVVTYVRTCRCLGFSDHNDSGANSFPHCGNVRN